MIRSEPRDTLDRSLRAALAPSRLVRLARSLPRPAAGTLLFCLFMTFGYCPYDFLLKPVFQGVAGAQEVWLGVRLYGWYAKLTEPIHWAIYAGLVYGIVLQRPWAWPSAAAYTAVVGVTSIVWCWLYASYGPVGWAFAVLVTLAFFGLAADLWRLGPRTPLLPPA